MITFDQITKLFTFNTKKKFCVEIQFLLIGNPKYDYCWMGKMWGKDEQKAVFWYGLTPDGKNAFDHPSFEEMANAPVFDGLSLKDVWDHIVIEEIDGCDPQERLENYIGDKPNRRMMGALNKRIIDEQSLRTTGGFCYAERKADGPVSFGICRKEKKN